MPDEKRIKDFEPATELLIDDWFAVDSPSQGTRKMQASMFQEGLQTQITANTENIALHSGQISVLQQAVGNIGDELNSSIIKLSPTTRVTITTITGSSTERDFTVETDGIYNFYSVTNSTTQPNINNIKLANSNGETLWIGQNIDNNNKTILSSPIFYLKAGTYKLTIEGAICGYRKYTL